MASKKVIESPVTREGRQGFLPFPTNTFDRYFISVMIFVALSLLWMRFVEAFLPLWISTVIAIVIGYIVVRKG